MKIILPIALFFLITSSGQNKTTDLNGIYYSVDNEFERWSIMELGKNGTFTYKYGLSACQAEITGTYFVENKRIHFKNDREFTKEYLKFERDSLLKLDSLFMEIGIPIYPDLSLTEWKIKKNSIKPIYEINCGCFFEKGKHIKKFTNK